MSPSHLEWISRLARFGRGSWAPRAPRLAGFSEVIQDVCNRLAEEGFVAYAPDLYHGKHAATIDEAAAFSDQLDDASAKTDFAAGLDALWERLRAPRAGWAWSVSRWALTTPSTSQPPSPSACRRWCCSTARGMGTSTAEKRATWDTSPGRIPTSRQNRWTG